MAKDILPLPDLIKDIDRILVDLDYALKHSRSPQSKRTHERTIKFYSSINEHLKKVPATLVLLIIISITTLGASAQGLLLGEHKADVRRTLLVSDFKPVDNPIVTDTNSLAFRYEGLTLVYMFKADTCCEYMVMAKRDVICVYLNGLMQRARAVGLDHYQFNYQRYSKPVDVYTFEYNKPFDLNVISFVAPGQRSMLCGPVKVKSKVTALW